MTAEPTNPFRYGDLALGEAFTDRGDELEELRADMRNGQNVVVFAPRRYGKSSLVWRVSQQVLEEGILVARVNLMTTPTKEKLAEKLARSIHEDVASPLFRARDRLRVFRGLRVAPVLTVDPDNGSISFSFQAAHRPEDVDATLERLLELPAELAADRGRRVAMVLDEFQEVVDIDPHLPKLMRSVFQQQTEVAHVYLGSKRHMMERIFNDENEPFWRSAKQMELGVIATEAFRGYIEARLQATGKQAETDVIERVLAITGGHPYATQELCYFLWEETAAGETALQEQLHRALTNVLRSENSHFTLVWENASAVQRLVLTALSREPGRALSGDYRRRHGLPVASSVQKALAVLSRRELVARDPAGYRIAEPFLAEWITRAGF
jgi:uncharacterized protein